MKKAFLDSLLSQGSKAANTVSKHAPEYIDKAKTFINKEVGKTTSSQNSLIKDSALGGALTGAGIAGIGSLFTDAGFMESALMGGITGGIGAGALKRSDILGADRMRSRIRSNQNKMQRADKLMQSGDRKVRKRAKQIKKSGQRQVEANQNILNTVPNKSYGLAGTLAGAGSLAYATLDSNRG